MHRLSNVKEANFYIGRIAKVIRTLFNLLNCKENEGLIKRLGIAVPSLYYFLHKCTALLKL